jgi:uncharacterized spore protein YtfJ
MSDSNANSIHQLVQKLLEGVRTLSRSETVIGEPLQAGEATIIPVHRLRVGFAAGTAELSGQQNGETGQGGGQGVGGTVRVEPIAVIAIGRDGAPRLLTVEPEGADGWQGLLNQLPDVAQRVARTFGGKLAERITDAADDLLDRKVGHGSGEDEAVAGELPPGKK